MVVIWIHFGPYRAFQIQSYLPSTHAWAIIIRSCPHSDFDLMSNFKSFFREALHSRFFEKEQMREFNAVKMVFEFHLESGSSVMPAHRMP